MTERSINKLSKLDELARRGATEGERSAAKLAAEKLRRKMNGGVDAEYERWVTEGRAAAEQSESAQWMLGELASKVDKKYGESRLVKYASDVGVAYQTLAACRVTYIKWQKLGRPNFSFAAARALNALDESQRAKIVKEKPNLTREEARKLAREHRRSEPRAVRKVKRKAERANELKNKDEGKREGDMLRILDAFLGQGSEEVTLLRSLHYYDGPAVARRVLASLENLRSRLNAEIAWVKSVNKLG